MICLLRNVLTQLLYYCLLFVRFLGLKRPIFLAFSYSAFIFFLAVCPANAVLDQGEEVPNYVRSDITGFDFHGQDLSKSSIAGAIARDADFSDVDLHGTVLTLSDLKGSNLNGVDLSDTLSDRVNFQ